MKGELQVLEVGREDELGSRRREGEERPREDEGVGADDGGLRGAPGS